MCRSKRKPGTSLKTKILVNIVYIANKALLIKIVQAFVAMGGEPNGKGFISTDKLKQIIKSDFEMTIDIEVNFALHFSMAAVT